MKTVSSLALWMSWEGMDLSVIQGNLAPQKLWNAWNFWTLQRKGRASYQGNLDGSMIQDDLVSPESRHSLDLAWSLRGEGCSWCWGHVDWSKGLENLNAPEFPNGAGVDS